MSWSEELREREIESMINEIRKEALEYKQLKLENHNDVSHDWVLVKKAEKIIGLQHKLIVKLS